MPEKLVKTVLVVTAHPDDVDFGAAGTIARWSAEGISVHYAIVTDGDAGGFDDAVDRSEIAGIRQREQRAAAKAVGVEDVTFLGYRDGQVVSDLGLRKDISREIRRVRPDRILIPSSERDFSRLPASHPDHLAVGEAAICAIYPDARNPYAYPELRAEGFEAHTVTDIWIMAGPRSDFYVDITDHIDQKIEALGCHESQLSEPESTFDRVRTWTSATAITAGFGEDHFAEAFFRISV